MRHIGLYIILTALLMACSNENISDNSNNKQTDSIFEITQKIKTSDILTEDIKSETLRTDKRIPSKSEITNPYYSPDLLFYSWAHKTTDDKPAFTIDGEYFRISYEYKTVNLPYILKLDSIEIFEYHHGETSKGKITKLSKDSLIIKWTTGDESKYVRHEK